MIVMHPQEIAWTDKLRKGHCKCTVNSQVTGIVGPREICQAHAVMHRWPESPVGETIIVFLTVKRRQVHERILNTPSADHSGLGSRVRSHLAAPAEPESVIGLKRLSQCNGQTSRSPSAGSVGNRYP